MAVSTINRALTSPVDIADGGTGGNTKATARANLEVICGVRGSLRQVSYIVAEQSTGANNGKRIHFYDGSNQYIGYVDLT